MEDYGILGLEVVFLCLSVYCLRTNSWATARASGM